MNYNDALIAMKEGGWVKPPSSNETWCYDTSQDSIIRKLENGDEHLLQDHPDILQALAMAAKDGWVFVEPTEGDGKMENETGEQPYWWEEVDFAPEAPRVLKRGDRDEPGEQGHVFSLQEELVRVGASLTPDGDYGPATERAVREFQRRVGLVADGVFGDKTAAALNGHPFPGSLQQTDLEWAASELACDVAAVMAVSEVESRGRGFFGSGKPAILFERHWMRRRLNHYGIDPTPYIRKEPNIVNSKTGGYKGGEREHERLAKAAAIHETSALESASWGAYQIMGFHWHSLGYDSVQHFVKEMEKGERQHLEAFVRFIKNDHVLLKAIRNRAWASFAKRYNGPAYKRNSYDTKMANAYTRSKEALG